MNRIVLKPKRDWSVRHLHPWIFSGAIGEVTGAPGSGETVEVFDSCGEKLGSGSYSPASQIRVRMLAFNDDEVDGEYVERLVAASIGRRAPMFVQGYTNAFRLVNAESDRLPGVVVDFYDGWAVVQLASAGAERWKDVIAGAVMKYAPGCRGVWNRSDVDSRAKEGLPQEGPGATGHLLGEEPPPLVEIAEGQVGYLVDIRRGHKTGFYLDQRDARALVGQLANGADMLNAFSYTGGFGLAARAAGAQSVTQLDISAEALEIAKKNEALGHFCATQINYERADVFKQLRLYRDQGRSFDFIVLDPPKFSDTRAGVMRAARGYKDINLLAMKLLRPGGTLATFSCSGAMTPELFDKVVGEAAFDAKRDFQIVSRTRAGADHPVLLAFPEGLYLKGLVLRALD